ncbi:MAG TPA: LemA family protein [Bryobacteraceae bacterium]|nr:LemA family protein [Bryobacteraceae bacterium]
MSKLLALALLAAALLFGAHCRNVHQDLLAERQTIDADWSAVDAALQHRADLTADLTKAVGSEAPAESAAILRVDDARNLLRRARDRREKMGANARLDMAIGGLMLLVENYPRLQASKRYADLLDALKGAEYQIAVARRKYNEAVEHYNARIELFPANLVASVSGLRKVDAYFQAPAI